MADHITTTLNKIRAHSPCRGGWEKLLRHLGKTKADDESVSLLTILESNGLGDALWCLRAVEGHQREIRLYAVWCARQVQHLMTDPRSLVALDVAERHAKGPASDAELDAARDVAWVAAWDAARDVAIAAERAAVMAHERVAAWDAAWNAAIAAERAVAGAAAWDAAWNAVMAAERDAARAAQTVEFRRVFGSHKEKA